MAKSLNIAENECEAMRLSFLSHVAQTFVGF